MLYSRPMKILGYQPTRRGLLKALTVALVAAPIVKLGQALPVAARRTPRRPKDISQIPWIGHC